MSVWLPSVSRRGGPRSTIPLTLGIGFLALNILGMLVTDFFIGLALFHPAIGLVTLLALRRARWLGAATLALSVALGVVT